MREEVEISDLCLPSMPLSLVENATRNLNSKLSLSTFVDMSLLDCLLAARPIRVRSVKRHFEIVGEFRSFHIASAMLNPKTLVPVEVVEGTSEHHAELAVAALVMDVLDCAQGGLEERRLIYRELKSLAQSLNKYSKVRVPNVLGPRSLRAALNIDANQVKKPRARQSDFSKLVMLQAKGRVVRKARS